MSFRKDAATVEVQSVHDSERQPLLPAKPPTRTPLPKLQIGLVMFARLGEPIA